MNIRGTTRVCALVGDPVEHTMSPAMHNAAFTELGLDMVYVPFRVKPGELAAAVGGFRALNVAGFNITIPHKVSVIPLLDGLDPQAEKIGAVNTVVNDEGELRGYNTDAAGFLRALLERGVEPDDSNIVVLGAGGASRAICYVLAERGAHLTVLNRLEELDWAKDIAELIAEDLGRSVRVLELEEEALEESMAGAEILVNATSVGMVSDRSLVPARLFHPGLTVFDIVYNPMKTRLLRDAEAAGARTIGGVEMLVWQGALAFEKWTSQTAPFELMRRVAIGLLEKNEI